MASVNGLRVAKSGPLALIQDDGRFGYHSIGLTNGGPLDCDAFYWANRLCQNRENDACIEVNLGGLTLTAEQTTSIAVTGAEAPLLINHRAVEQWRTHAVKPGDTIEIGFASRGARIYLAVAGGFQIQRQFGSCAAVVREGIGGLNGGPLQAGDLLPCPEDLDQLPLLLPTEHRPKFPNHAELRVVPGYQAGQFPSEEKERFFDSEYQLTPHCDRMGFRLKGAAISSGIASMLSEGISLGTIQIPTDGQPIVLLHDRQTIGGYPKIGSVISPDLNQLTQLHPGDSVRFKPISIQQAETLYHAHKRQLAQTALTSC